MSSELRSEMERQFPVMVRVLAGHLGAKVVQEPEDARFAKLTVPIEGVDLPLSLHINAWDGKVHSSLDWVDYVNAQGSKERIQPSQALTYEERYKGEGLGAVKTSIASSTSRPAEAIAKDIKRRLVNKDVLAIYRRMQERAKENGDAETGKRKTVEFLARTLNAEGYRQGGHNGGFSTVLYGDGPRLDVQSSDNVRFEHFYCDAETAVKIVRLLANAKKA